MLSRLFGKSKKTNNNTYDSIHNPNYRFNLWRVTANKSDDRKSPDKKSDSDTPKINQKKTHTSVSSRNSTKKQQHNPRARYDEWQYATKDWSENSKRIPLWHREKSVSPESSIKSRKNNGGRSKKSRVTRNRRLVKLRLVGGGNDDEFNQK